MLEEFFFHKKLINLGTSMYMLIDRYRNNMYTGITFRGVTIRMPHDTIRIENSSCDTILFDTIHICTVKSYRLVIRLYMSPSSS